MLGDSSSPVLTDGLCGSLCPHLHLATIQPLLRDFLGGLREECHLLLSCSCAGQHSRQHHRDREGSIKIKRKETKRLLLLLGFPKKRGQCYHSYVFILPRNPWIPIALVCTLVSIKQVQPQLAVGWKPHRCHGPERLSGNVHPRGAERPCEGPSTARHCCVSSAHCWTPGRALLQHLVFY